MACLYYHTNIKTGAIFYIGVSISLIRPYSKQQRNAWWNNYVHKHGGFNVVIVKDNIEFEQALKLEVAHIKKHKGKLVNLTDGGEGSLGCHKTRSKEARKRMKKAQIKYWQSPASKETKKKISQANLGKSGNKISESIKKHWLKRKVS